MITYETVPLEQVNIDKVRTLLASPEFALLKSIIGAKATQATVQYANASLYESEAALQRADVTQHRARAYTTALDVLDEIEQKQEWFVIKLDQRR